MVCIQFESNRPVSGEGTGLLKRACQRATALYPPQPLADIPGNPANRHKASSQQRSKDSRRSIQSHTALLLTVLLLSCQLSPCLSQMNQALISPNSTGVSLQNLNFTALNNTAFMVSPTDMDIYAFASSNSGNNTLKLFGRTMNPLGSTDQSYNSTKVFVKPNLIAFVAEKNPQARIRRLSITESMGPSVSIGLVQTILPPFTFGNGYLSFYSFIGSNYVYIAGDVGVVNRYDVGSSVINNISNFGIFPIRAIEMWDSKLILLSERVRIVDPANSGVIIKTLRDLDYASKYLLIDPIPHYNGRAYVDCEQLAVCLWDLMNDVNQVSYAINPKMLLSETYSGMINAGNLDFIIIPYPGSLVLRFIRKSTWTFSTGSFSTVLSVLSGGTAIQQGRYYRGWKVEIALLFNDSPYYNIRSYYLESDAYCLTRNSGICIQCVPNYYRDNLLINNRCILKAEMDLYFGVDVPNNKQTQCSNGCVECREDYLLCTACSPGFYLDGAVCTVCPTFCLTCISATSCLTCQPGKGLDGGTCRDCLGTEFLDGTVCAPCTSPCASCTGSATSCTGCIPTTYLNGSNSCLNCTSPCLDCLTTATTCTSCVVSSPIYNLTGTSCLQCSPGTFFNGTICVTCTSPCASCNAPGNQCLTCIPGTALSGFSCQACHPSCATCTSNTASSCSSCPAGFSLLSNTCFPIVCNPGSYLIASTCLPCSSSCLTCSTTSTNCLACSPGKYLSANACVNCHSACWTCSAGLSSDCTSCSPGFQLSAGSCIESYCPPSKFMNNGFCTPCHPSCSSCSGGSSYNCTVCQMGFSLSSGTCSPIVCPEGAYLSGNDCLNCHAYCSTCQGPSSVDCLRCPAGFTLKPNGFCERQCLSNQYNDNADNLCYTCDSQCQKCNKSGRFGCTSCLLTETLRFDGLCVKTCFQGFYYLDSENQCYQCDSSCKSCSGPGPSSCIECKNGLLVQVDKTCRAGCPQGTVAVNNMRCEKCHPSCLNCTDPSETGCSECILGLYRLPNSKCDSTIPNSHFYDSVAKVVKACHSDCSTCNGATSTDCLSCRNQENIRLTADQRCVDCLSQYSQYPETCSYVVPIRLGDPMSTAVNAKASSTFKITFDGESKYSKSLTLQRFRDSIQMEIIELSPQDYTVTLEQREGGYVIDIFTSKSQTAPVTLKVAPTKTTILEDPNTGLVTLIFLPTAAIKIFQLKEAPNAGVMDSLGSIGASSQGAVGVVSAAASAFSALSILASSPLMTPLIKFLKIFKLISRLKLINIFFGAYLEFVLDLSGRMFAIGNDTQDFRFKQFDMTTRGKLTRFKITTVSVEVVWVKYMVYFIILAVRVYQAILRKYVTRRAHFSGEDQIVDKIADESRIIIFTMVVIDITFYSIRCVSHLNLGQKQSRDSIISFVLSFITIIAVSVDVLLLFLSNKDMNLEKVLKERRVAERREKNDIVRRKRLESFMALKGNTTNEPVEDQEKETNEQNQSPKVRFLKPTENNSQAAVNFFTEGIITDKITTARYFNSISLVKLLVVEPFYVTLQLYPTAQILCLVGIQLSYFIYFCRHAFGQKAFESRANVIQILVNELAILVFLMIGAIFQVAGGAKDMNTAASNALQIVGIAMLVVSCVLGASVMLWSIIATVCKVINNRMANKMRKAYTKIFRDPMKGELPPDDDNATGEKSKEPDPSEKDGRQQKPELYESNSAGRESAKDLVIRKKGKGEEPLEVSALPGRPGISLRSKKLKQKFVLKAFDS